jgi:hypothetical protein
MVTPKKEHQNFECRKFIENKKDNTLFTYKI